MVIEPTFNNNFKKLFMLIEERVGG